MIVSQSDFENLEMSCECWNILVVDDEPDVMSYTSFVLEDLKIAGLPLEFIEARSMAEAKDILSHRDDIGVMLLDVVMESDDAGLQFVEYVRDELKNQDIRILLRTGQPGYAPESEVVQKYDIDDYLEKSDLTDVRLTTSVTSAIRAYIHILYLKLLQEKYEKLLEEREGEIKEIEENLKIEHEGQLDSSSSNAKELFSEMANSLATLCKSGEMLEKISFDMQIEGIENLDYQKESVFTMITIALAGIDSYLGVTNCQVCISDTKISLELSCEEPIKSTILDQLKIFCDERSIKYLQSCEGSSLKLEIIWG